MKIRNRITLWITGVGLLAGFFFSLVVFYEMIEQPYRLLDAELASQAHAVLADFAPATETPAASRRPPTVMKSLDRSYWIKVFDEKHALVFASSMARYADLPLYHKRHGYTVTIAIPRQVINLGQDDGNEVAFRVRSFTLRAGGRSYLVQIAKPMEKLAEEISGLLISLFLGLIGSGLVLVLVGYYVAGRILRPISTINNLAREITDRTLDKRIPAGGNRDEINELSSTLNHMFDRLQLSFTRQKEFVASASHELKTPITLQRLFLEEAVHRRDLPSSFREQLITQSAALFRMDRLVKNLLDLSALELKKTYEPGELDLARLTHSVFEEFAEIIKAANIRLTVVMPEPFPIHADREKIRRVLINLIDNAIKYNHEGGEIQFRADTDRGRVRIELFNTGPGVPARDLERVFEQFYRVEKSRSIAHGGSGLGLAIVKRIIQLHGGTVTMESKAGAWTRIRIVLPASCSPAAN